MAANQLRTGYEKISAQAWEHMRRLYEGGASPGDLCARFRVSQSTFFSRRKREHWRQNLGIERPEGFGFLASGDTGDRGPGGSQVNDSRSPSRAEPQDLESQFVVAEPLAAVSPWPPPPTLSSQQVAVNQKHLTLARNLRERIDELTMDLNLGAGEAGRRSRAVVDLATAVEKLQRIERTALQMHSTDSGDRPPVVIVVPGKMELGAWERAARAMATEDGSPIDDRGSSAASPGSRGPWKAS